MTMEKEGNEAFIPLAASAVSRERQFGRTSHSNKPRIR